MEHHFVSKPLLPLLCLGITVGVWGCVGSIHDGEGTPSDPQNPPVLDPTDPPSVSECATLAPDTALAGVRRLTAEQYANSVRDLLGDRSGASDTFVVDGVTGGYASNTDSSVDGTQLENYLFAAEAIASDYVDNRLAGELSCDLADRACVAPFLTTLAGHAFRQPLTTEASDALVAVYEIGRDQWGAAAGVQLAVEGILMSPHFLYLIELEPAGTDDVVGLSAFELAARLSYFLWNTTPDDELLRAAGAGELATDEGIQTQVARLMANQDRFVDTLESFHAQWLEFDTQSALDKDADEYPNFNTAQADSMRRGIRAFVGEVFTQDDASLETLLTAPYAFADADSADVLGVAAPSGMTRFDFDPEERGGILSQPRVLAAHAHQADVSWVSRGLLVRRQILCQELPAPPPDVTMEGDLDPSRVTNPECSGCHTLIDPVGQAFDNFDAIGAYRTVLRDGSAVDSAGDLEAVTGVDPAFEGASELGHLLANTEEAQACMSRQWLRYAMARHEEAGDSCSLAHIQERFSGSDYDLRELLTAIATSDSFRLRRRSEEDSP